MGVTSISMMTLLMVELMSSRVITYTVSGIREPGTRLLRSPLHKLSCLHITDTGMERTLSSGSDKEWGQNEKD